MSFSLSVIALALSIIFVVARILQSAFSAPLVQIPPAHWTCRFSPLWILWMRYQRLENKSIHAAHQRLGAVVRLAPYEVSINDLGGIRTVYTGGWEKHPWYLLFRNHDLTENMFTMLDSQSHSQRKRQLSNVYAKSFLLNSDAFQAITERLVQQKFLAILTQSANENSALPLYNLLCRLTMDVMSAYVFGIDNGTNMLESPTDFANFEKVYVERGKHAFLAQELPLLSSPARLLGVAMFSKQVDAARNGVDSFSTRLCEQAHKALQAGELEGSQAVVFKQMVKAKTKADQYSAWDRSNPANKICASELLDHLLAGFETTAIALTYALYWLSMKPEIQEELHEELFTQRKLSGTSAGSGLPSSRELDQLPLLHAVLMETLRLNAPIPGAEPRISSEGSLLKDYGALPKGVRISAQPYSLHRNAEIFPEPEEWKPYRWIANGASQEAHVKEMSRWFWAFSSGGRMCIGSNFAILESKAVLAAVYSNFETRIQDASGIEQEDGYTVGPKGDIALAFRSVNAAKS